MALESLRFQGRSPRQCFIINEWAIASLKLFKNIEYELYLNSDYRIIFLPA